MLTKNVNIVIIFYSLSLFSCAPKTQILDRYDNGRMKLSREYKVMKDGVSSDSVTIKLVNYYRNGMKFYVQDIKEGQPNGKILCGFSPIISINFAARIVAGKW